MFHLNTATPVLLAILAAGVWTHAFQNAAAPEPSKDREAKRLSVDELVVKRIDIVGEDGRPRLVLSNSDRFPNPRLKGKEYPRSIHPAGIVFYRSNGDECGGIAMAELAGASKNMLIFDYANTDGIGIGAYETEQGTWGSGLSISDRLPLDSDIEKVGTEGVERVSVSNDGGTAQVLLLDSGGKPRIRLAIDAKDQPTITVLDADGKVVWRVPATGEEGNHGR